MAGELRNGYTTGSCAAAAAKGAALMLLDRPADRVEIATPAGGRLCLGLEGAACAGGEARAAVKKDSGDDPDVTNGILIFARVRLAGDGITIEGGEGIGRVTRPGLACPPGSAAINPGPRQMIRRALEEAAKECGYAGGFWVEISAPQGRALAEKTYNPRLGIVGGISILGSTGIVKPMSEEALVQSIHTEINVLKAEGVRVLLAAPGSYGEEFLKESLRLDLRRGVQCSNFIGDTVEYAARLGFEGMLLAGHAGKLVKLAAGMLNTHSRYGDCRMEVLAAHGALAGAPAGLIRQVMGCVSAEGALQLYRRAGLLEPVMESIARKIEEHLARPAGAMPVGAVIFTKELGLIGCTSQARPLLARLRGDWK